VILGFKFPILKSIYNKNTKIMASSAERLASNMNLGMFAKATELKKRLWFVVMALIVYRLGAYIPLPGIDPLKLADIFEKNSGGILGMFDMFSGGSLRRMSIFALNVVPYISSSIIMQLLMLIYPSFGALKKEGQAGKNKINKYTRYGTVVLAAVQGYGIAVGLENMLGSSGSAVINAGLYFRLTTAVTLVGGTLFLVWLGEQITTRGIGNGISLIIFAGIVAAIPQALISTFEMGRRGILSTEIIIVILILALGLVLFIVFFERAQRKIMIQYPKRQQGNRLIAGGSQPLPLKLNTAGVMPPIFASSVLLFPVTIAKFNSGGEGVFAETMNWISAYMAHGQPLYIALYVTAILIFSFFYAAILFNPKDVAENLKKNGGFVAGIRPGSQTQEYLDKVLTRLTVIGAIYLSVVCVIPELLIAKAHVPFYLGGTSLLIVVSVTMDTVAQIQSHLFSHQYEGLIKKSKLKGKGKGKPRGGKIR